MHQFGVTIFLLMVNGIVVLTGQSVRAQDISFTAGVDKQQVKLGDQITFTLSISGNVQSVPEPTLPDLSQFGVFSSGRSQNFSFINGRVSSSVSYSYTLVPRAVGKFIIGAARIVLNQKTYQTSPISIEVIQGGASIPPSSRRPQSYSDEDVKSGLQDLFLTVTVDKKSPYVGEQVILSVKFYQAVRLFDQPEYSPPATTGFWVEQLGQARSYSEIVNQKKYLVNELRYALFPTTSGKLTVGSATVKCTVEDLERFFNRDPFELFGRDLRDFFTGGRPRLLQSRPIVLEVKPLPEAGKPASFTGAVGEFRLNAQVDKTVTNVNEPVTLKIIISGTGNVKSVTEPALSDLPDFRTYSSSSSEKLERDLNTLSGTKTFEKVLIPKNPGKFVIPPLEFSYFDPRLGRYLTSKSKSFELTVTGSAVDLAAGGYNPASVPATIVRDIRYLKTNGERLGLAKKPLIFSPIFWVIQIFPLLGAGYVLYYQRHREKLSADLSYARLHRAHKLARKRLKAAVALIGANGQKEFFAEISRALLHYIGDRFNISTFGMTTDELQNFLQSKGIQPELVTRLGELLSTLDLARFANSSITELEMRQTLERVEGLIVTLENLR